MSVFRLLEHLLGIIFILTMLYGSWLMMNHFSMFGERRTKPVAQAIKSELDIVNFKNARTRGFKVGYEGLVRFDEFVQGRGISLTVVVRLEDLLKHGEQSPEVGLEAVFAGARAIFYAKQECRRLLEVLAAKCKVSSASGRFRDGDVTIDARLLFVQRAAFGLADPRGKWSLNSIRTPLLGGQDERTWHAAPEVSAEIYRNIDSFCAELKRLEGNCSISNVHLSISRGHNNDYVSAGGFARYSYLSKLPQ